MEEEKKEETTTNPNPIVTNPATSTPSDYSEEDILKAQQEAEKAVVDAMNNMKTDK